FAGLAQLLAQARQVEHLDLHRYSSEYGMNFTMSPARIGCSAGLSTRPSAHAVDISTAESCVGYRSSPPRAFHFTRRNSRRGSGSGQSKSARTEIACACTSATPCVWSRNGRTNTRKVTKLETGFPGSPMKFALPTRPNASGRPGFMAIFHMRSSPSASTAGLTKSASPTETPPLVTITSHSAAARRSIPRVAGSESRPIPYSRASHPNLLHHDLVAFLRAVLLHHDGVRPSGNRCSRENARRGPRGERLARRAGGNLLGDLEPASGSFQIGETHRIAVHRAVVHGW